MRPAAPRFPPTLYASAAQLRGPPTAELKVALTTSDSGWRDQIKQSVYGSGNLFLAGFSQPHPCTRAFAADGADRAGRHLDVCAHAAARGPGRRRVRST